MLNKFYLFCTIYRFTNRVVTLWYRPPELLLGERNYGPPVDLWGAGCIMAEMWTRSPIMQGNTEQQQLTLISQLCGSITPTVWPGVEHLELYKQMELPQQQKRKVNMICLIFFINILIQILTQSYLQVKDRLKPYMKDAYACDLLDKLLVLDPSKRADADTALNHDFFWTDPMPCDLGKMLAQHSQSMFEFLAPPRRSRTHHTMANPRPTTSTMQDSGYQDRVF